MTCGNTLDGSERGSYMAWRVKTTKQYNMNAWGQWDINGRVWSPTYMNTGNLGYPTFRQNAKVGLHVGLLESLAKFNWWVG